MNLNSADVRLQWGDETGRKHDNVNRNRRNSHRTTGKLVPPCGPTRVPPQHAGPGPPLLPGKVARQAHAPANGGDADHVTQSQKDEWFV
ncbi:hypothetical protein NQ317_007728 [Molorchus minor]|uniref:Wingless n=1 Tax=Molorchus minor TaxID=1323400 RepID=A0ABQ9JV19_9CUCU|nr:hypothetical protein NQ317_007728 [Molorchus minor]